MRSRLIEVYDQERPGPFDCSIAVPVYNGAEFLAEAIASVLAQTAVVCDIVISDDGSQDGSLDGILKAVRSYPGPHSVRVYRTSVPAVSEHMPLLVAASRTDRILQAHQDDVSHPNRAKVLVRALSKNVRLVTSVANVRSSSGTTKPTPESIEALRKNDNFKAFLMSGQGVMGGARYGMHRAIFDRFPPLSWDYLSHGQDILLHIRAKMIGSCKVLYRPLLTIGDHPGRGSYLLFDNQHKATRGFDFALRRLVILSVAHKDLAHLRANGSIDPGRADRIERRLKEAQSAFLESLVANRELAMLRNFRLTWTKGRSRVD